MNLELGFPLASSKSVLEGHIHNDIIGQTRVFSHDDLFGIAKLFEAHQNSNATVLLITKNQNTMYAMRVTDSVKALAFFNKYNITINGNLSLEALEKEWKEKVYDAVNTCNPLTRLFRS